ncbi:sporulation protein YunB [Collibacillus ludicampi]|uniref:Sporulation protein YunB n=1 Tax=Collibacillus ludicampi TaxID=2771369 RepID=A0AAV4LI36_9BACL|nr:sporulation protein YunB [Collibacillus ludicampi]GIM47184.1 sporulation protein YunB [Collibacillus ludicampi]
MRMRFRFRRRRMRIRPARKPVNRWRMILSVTLITVFFLAWQTFYFVENNLRPTFLNLAESTSQRIATEAINDAIIGKISKVADYDKLIDLTQDRDGHVVAARLNFAETAKIQGEATSIVQGVLRDLQENKIEIPLGQAFHSTVFSTVGPKITLTMIPYGSARSWVETEFKQAGINQTLSIIYLNIETQVGAIVPLASKQVQVQTKIPIAYTVLVGDVPQYFYDATGSPYIPKGFPSYQGTPPELSHIPGISSPSIER